MFGTRAYHYLVDGLTDEKAAVLRKSLTIVPQIRRVQISVGRGTVEVHSRRDVADQVRLACDVAGLRFRTRAKL